ALLGWLNPLRWLVVISSGKPPEDESKTNAEAQAELKRARVVAALQSKLVVRMQRRSYIIQSQATSESPAKAALIANTWADAYVVD
ncbi:hypothetical protein ACSLVQ_29165, partial [Klebsiella pneumoniae]|uniref:hypothetical protein n=1 Tax=Klebsiella pneumoniae TaxID=573 RepID=UPI003EE1ACC6